MKEKDECILDVWLLKPKRNKAIQTQNDVFFHMKRHWKKKMNGL